MIRSAYSLLLHDIVISRKKILNINFDLRNNITQAVRKIIFISIIIDLFL